MKCESTSRRLQPGEGPNSGLLCDCTTSPINPFAALLLTLLQPRRGDHQGEHRVAGDRLQEQRGRWPD